LVAKEGPCPHARPAQRGGSTVARRLARVEAFVLASNEASLRLLDRLGFGREAMLPAHGEDESGVLRDEWRCALQAGTWKRRRAG